VAQTSCAMPNHFYKSILAANEYDGPAVVSVYTTCQPEHGVGDNMAMEQSKLAVETRTFPVLMYDPRKGLKIAERLSLQGNPATKEDWFVEPKTNEKYDFVKFARSEGRFSKHFKADGTPSTAILASNQERLENWRTLQELAGIL
jgi:pyruvate ferredoxin oxidoreductase beta subunit